MKTTFRIVAVLALCLTFSLAAQAQRGDRGERPTPAQMAERQTTHMSEELDLAETQIPQVQEINLRYAQKLHEARAENQGDRASMKEISSTIRDEKRSELQTVLTEDQFAKLQEMGKQDGPRRRGRRGGKRS